MVKVVVVFFPILAEILINVLVRLIMKKAPANAQMINIMIEPIKRVFENKILDKNVEIQLI